MGLRIISGELKGRIIKVSEKAKKQFRPTTERARESVAEILKVHLLDAYVADVCAGSGTMGFEMLSRGAKRVDFIESDKVYASGIEKNSEYLAVKDRVRVIRQDVRKFVTSSDERYQLIYYDPPYDCDQLPQMVPLLVKRLSPEGILVYERRRLPGEKKPDSKKAAENMYDRRIFGDTVVEFYKIHKS
ncbi:16S rRNA (guanine(966)-N(2))-methyltransferase [Chitinispirillum alkaliphilum]|nr:16S rRNA (guanine(966)-N(2))-methyltransferase [Chitinispirillum alkaliphilum]